MDFEHLGFDNFLSTSNNGGVGFLKHERAMNDDDLRDFKVAKTQSSYYCGEAMLRFPLQRSNGCSEGNQQMLSFSSPTSQPVTLSYFQHATAAFGRNTGYGCTGGVNGGSMQGVRGLFTPSQWMELEHQALIYKYIIANVPIPSYLLNPISKAFESAGFSGFRSNALGWGGFNLGFSNGDPEPGRCRRTDGKKWRCSRDAVADQKYCERHMNRGRHRSRKPVEGQSGHTVSATTTTTNGKLTPMSSTSSASTVVPAGGVYDALHLSHPPSRMPTLCRSTLPDKENSNGTYQHTTLLSMTSRKLDPEDEFGLVCSDSLLNPLNRSSSLVTSRSHCPPDNLDDHNKSHHHPLRQFIDDWPKTQLSISIPIATSDFTSSTSSPSNEKLTASPSRLSEELEMGLGVGSISMGGPLAEVLHNSTGECKNTKSKSLNLMDRWDSSPRLASSPTGVLQRGPFVSISNGSAASSPRTESGLGPINPGLVNPSLPAI